MSAAQHQAANNIPLPLASEVEEILPDAAHASRECFIPLRKADLLALLVEQPDLSPAEREQFVQICRLIEATFHHEFHRRLEDLKDAYAPFDPDADTVRFTSLTDAERDARAESLFAQFVALMERCNFRRLSRADLEAAMKTVSDWGVNLQVDFDVFDRLEIFARGDAIGRRSRRRWLNRYRLEEVDASIYQRMVLIFRLADHEAMENAATDAVYIKIFKNIHKQDLEMLLPGSSIKMSLIDRTKIAFPTLSGLGISAYKITLLKGGIAAALAGGIWGIFGLATVAATLIGYGVKSFFSYLTTKNKYQLSLTRSLYFQNLDNNAGVLCRLIDEAEEQECREAWLAWWLLWRRAGHQGWTVEELDRRAETLLHQQAGVHVDFEVSDALAKLKRLRLINTTPHGTLVAAPAEQCLELLDAAWDNQFRYANESVNDRGEFEFTP